MSTDVELTKKAIRELGDDATMEQITAWVNAAKTLESVKEGGDAKPAEEKPAAEASLSVAEPVEKPAEEPAKFAVSEAAMGDLMAWFDALMQSLGLDEASTLAGLRDQADAILGILQGQAPNGAPAEEASAAALSASKERVKALEAAVAARDAQLAENAAKVAEMSQAEDARQIDDAISSGHILAASRDVFVRLARANRDEFVASLAEAAKGPAVPVMKLVRPKGPDATNVDESNDESHLRRALKNARIPAKRIDQIIAERRS